MDGNEIWHFWVMPLKRSDGSRDSVQTSVSPVLDGFLLSDSLWWGQRSLSMSMNPVCSPAGSKMDRARGRAGGQPPSASLEQGWGEPPGLAVVLGPGAGCWRGSHKAGQHLQGLRVPLGP